MSDRSSHSAATLLVPLTMVIILLLCIIPYNPELPVETEIEYTGGMIETAIMVKDIVNGSSGSYPNYLATIGNTLYFSANDGSSGSELWKSDGTDAGTVMVKDIRPGGTSSIPISLTVVGNTLYFSANDGNTGRELWKSDGTNAGTMRVKDINIGSSTSSSLSAEQLLLLLENSKDNAEDNAQFSKEIANLICHQDTLQNEISHKMKG